MSLLVEIRGDQRLKHLLHESNYLGRAPGNSIQLSDPLASRYHAEILRREDGEFEIVDLGSRHGTFVQGASIRERVLEPGDEIIVGASRFRFEPEEEWDGDGKRWNERLDCLLPVRVFLPGRNIDTHATDLSVGGIRLALDEDLPATTVVKLSIGFPGRKRRFRVAGRITANPSAQKGVGIAFVFDTPGQETVVASEFARLMHE